MPGHLQEAASRVPSRPGGDGPCFRSWIQILNPLIEPSNSQTGRDPRFGRLKEPLAIKHDYLKVLVPNIGNKTV